MFKNFLGFFFILAPYLDFVGYLVNMSIVIVFLVLIYAISISSVIPKVIINFFVFCMIVTGYSIFLNLVFGNAVELTIVKICLSLFSYVLFGYFFATIFYDHKTNVAAVDDLIKIFTTAIIINSLVIVVQFLVPEFRTSVESILADAGNIDFGRVEEKRFRGLASSGGASLAVAHGIAICLLILNKSTFNIKNLGGILIIFASMILIGRTGFFVPIIFLTLLAIITLRKDVFLKIINFSILAAILLWFGVSLVEGTFYEKYVFGFIRVEFIAWIMEQGLEQILAFYTIPPNALIGITGSGSFTGVWPGPNITGNTVDSGWMRMWTNFGVLALVIYWGIGKYFYTLISCVSVKEAKLWIVLLLVLVLLDGKEMMSFTGYSSRFLFFGFGVFVFLRFRSKCVSSNGPSTN